MGGTYTGYINSLFVEQKKLLRIMSYRYRYDHTHPLFVNYRLLKLPDIVHLQTSIFVFKNIHSCPVNLFFERVDRTDTS